jgi:hypothetical protein
MELFCFCEGMSSFEFPVRRIRVELSNVLIDFRNRNGSWIYSVQNCLEEFIAEFPNVIVDGKLRR